LGSVTSGTVEGSARCRYNALASNRHVQAAQRWLKSQNNGANRPSIGSASKQPGLSAYRQHGSWTNPSALNPWHEPPQPWQPAAQEASHPAPQPSASARELPAAKVNNVSPSAKIVFLVAVIYASS
jgi:hypothetical protein